MAPNRSRTSYWGVKMIDPSWRFYEVKKRMEELEAVVLKQRRFMIFLNACLLISFIFLLMTII